MGLTKKPGFSLIYMFLNEDMIVHDKHALATVRARPFSRSGDPVLWDLVEALAERVH